MSLSRIIKAPIKLFKKEVITFLIIRRHDLGEAEEKLRYVSVKPTASISVLRQKIWHLLDLPDYCEEIIVLKSGDQELPLTELRIGNDPQHPFLLEVWLPDSFSQPTYQKNMLTLGESDNSIADNDLAANNSITGQVNQERITTFMENSMEHFQFWSQRNLKNPTYLLWQSCFCVFVTFALYLGTWGSSLAPILENKKPNELMAKLFLFMLYIEGCSLTPPAILIIAKPLMVSSNDKVTRRVTAEKRNNFLYSDFKKPDLASRISSTSVFKLYKNKNRDSFTNILLKIQSDLSTLSNKLSNLENRIPPS